jgi:hypothetical protein
MSDITHDLRGGYTQEQLEEAFALVKPKPYWKAPINAIVPGDTDLELLEFAIGYFTGGSFTTCSEQRDGTFFITSPGYWDVIGS